MFHLGNRSQRRLEGVHSDLQAVVELAITLTTVDFTVLEGVRSHGRQLRLYAVGATSTMNSRHLVKKKEDGGNGFGHAVDLGAWVDGGVRWDWPLYYKIADAMIEAADELDISIRWGGDWDSDGEYDDEKWRDGPHFELSWAEYPA